jgi:hypothetical protein
MDLLKELAKRTLEDKNKTRISQIFPVLTGVNSCGVSLCFNIRNGLLTEAFIIARAFLERIVNVSYLMICEQSQFEDFIHFSMQKVQRSMHAKQKAYKNIGHIIPVPDLSGISHVAKGLEKYTSPRGREITRWTNLNLEKRIEAVGKKVDLFNAPLFLAAYNYVYEDASEAVHGTLYGCLFHIGIFWGAFDEKLAEKYMCDLKVVLYMLMGLLVEGLLHVALTEVDVKDLVELSDENCNKHFSYFGKKKSKHSSA